MRAMHRTRGRQTVVLTTCLLLAALALPAVVTAHAELVSSSPEAGSTLARSPEAVTATFSEALEAPKSSIEVIAPDGSLVATGGLAPDDGTTLLVAVPALAPGTYDVRWTASSDDGHLERGRYEFTVAGAAGPGPTSEASSAPTAAAAASAAPTTELATASPAASSTPDGSDGGSESTGQILIVAVVGIALGVGIGWWRSRRAA